MKERGLPRGRDGVEIVTGHPGYREYREKFGPIPRHEAQEVQELKVKHNPWLMVAAVILSTGLSMANCYGLLRETDIRVKENELQFINERLLDNEVRQLRQYIDNVNYRRGGGQDGK